MDTTAGREINSDYKFWLVFEQAPIGVALISPTGRYLRANPELCRMLGYTEEELNVLTLAGTVHPEDQPIVNDLWNTLRSREVSSCSAEMRYTRRDGQAVWAVVAMSLVRDELGVPMQAIAFVEDITERKQAQMKLEKVEKRYEAIWDNLDDAIWINDLKGQFVFAGGASTKLLGYTPTELAGMNLFRYIHPDDRQVMYRAFKAFGEGSNRRVRMSYRIFRKDGTYIWLETNARPFSAAGDHELEIACVSRRGRDPLAGEAGIEELPEAVEQAQPPRVRYPTDKLTGVHHRSYIDDLLGTRLVSRRSAGFPFGVLLVDIDHFADLNKTYGQAVGDEILKRIAQVLQDGCRGEDTVGRAGDDDFLVMLPNTNPGGTIVTGERLVHSVRAIDWSDVPLESEVTISVGATCVIYGADLTLPELMGILHDQLAQAKESGRNRLVMNTRQVARYWDDG